MKTSPALRKAIAKYDKEHTTFIGIKLNNETDADILECLKNTENRQGYIKELIRADIASKKS